MFTFTRALRKERLAAENRHVGYSFARLFKVPGTPLLSPPQLRSDGSPPHVTDDRRPTAQKWQVEHCTLSLIGVGLDAMNGKGPMVSSVLGGFSFARLLLQLLEANEPQLWTVPNAVTGLRIAGVAAAGAVALRSAKADGAAVDGLPAWLLPDATLALLGFGFVAMDLLDGSETTRAFPFGSVSCQSLVPWLVGFWRVRWGRRRRWAHTWTGQPVRACVCCPSRACLALCRPPRSQRLFSTARVVIPETRGFRDEVLSSRVESSAGSPCPSLLCLR
jgi:hypothetical protein